MTRNRYRGFFSLESLATTLIWMTLIFVALNTTSQLTNQRAEEFHQQQRWDKLVSVADWVVKRGGAYENGEVVYPDWIDESRLQAIDREGMRERMGLEALSIGYTPGPGVCLYRLVVRGTQKEIVQLWVCGQ